ncbi:hypothetical protein Q3G72_033232 [Acer saccharum]|nr:hypothetical protein Q3G72_033232 [Acer saccharum]
MTRIFDNFCRALANKQEDEGDRCLPLSRIRDKQGFTSLAVYVHLCGHVWATLGSQTDVIPQADPLLQRDFSVSLLRLRLRS